MIEQSLVILGHGGLGKEIAAWIAVDKMPYSVAGFLDDSHSADEVVGPIHGHMPQGQYVYLTAFGDGAARHTVRKAFLERGAGFATIVAPVVRTATQLETSVNSMFVGACSISSNVKLGDDLLIQAMAIVGHDVEIGDGVTISSHAFIGGGAKLGRFSTIHPHAVVLPNVKIGEGAIIGAGSVVIKNVPDYTTVFGAPAKVLAQRPAS
ncbi:acetyltransferase [Leptospira sp. 96542]|nr:acetyltransferase [Leptospira sp. 96542]